MQLFTCCTMELRQAMIETSGLKSEMILIQRQFSIGV